MRVSPEHLTVSRKPKGCSTCIAWCFVQCWPLYIFNLYNSSQGWEKMWNQRWWPRNGCNGRLMAKISIMTIWVNLCVLLQVSLGLSTSSPLLKNSYHHNHFLAAIFDFTVTYFHLSFLGCTLYTAWLFLYRYHLFFGLWPTWIQFLPFSFFYRKHLMYQEEETFNKHTVYTLLFYHIYLQYLLQ